FKTAVNISTLLNLFYLSHSPPSLLFSRLPPSILPLVHFLPLSPVSLLSSPLLFPSTNPLLSLSLSRLFLFSPFSLWLVALSCPDNSGHPSPPGTPTIPLSQLQSHSLTLQGQHGATPASAQGQQAVFRFPAAVSLTGAGIPQQLQAIQVHPNAQANSSDGSPEISHSSANSTATVSLPATIVTSSIPTSVAGHMMYPSPHTVMYASSPSLDGGLAVLNAFSQGTSTMQVSHTQGQDTGGVQQVFLTAPSGTVQIPLPAVQLHPMVIGQQAGGSSTNLTELQVVNLEAAHNAKGD
uniref:Serum response factor n=1 Tax=Neogobius melanostomus TaxID=47308 RepID=A0A8C6TUH8_9GOBI